MTVAVRLAPRTCADTDAIQMPATSSSRQVINTPLERIRSLRSSVLTLKARAPPSFLLMLSMSSRPRAARSASVRGLRGAHGIDGARTVTDSAIKAGFVRLILMRESVPASAPCADTIIGRIVVKLDRGNRAHARANPRDIADQEECMVRRSLVLLLSVVLWLIAAPMQAQTPSEKLDITAFAVNMSNIGPAGALTVRIRINGWSTAAVRQRLITTMLEKGDDALLRELQKAPIVGRWNIPGLQGPDIHQLRLGHDIHYAWQTPLPEGGKKIVLATDRYIGFVEARDQPRTIDYPFTLMELRLDNAGKGEGKMAVATKISFDKKKNTMELENYASEPVRLNNLTAKVVK